MDELLKRLCELDPERFKGSELFYEVKIRGRWFKLVYLMNAPETVVYREAHLLLALLEALESRDCTWAGGSGYSHAKHSVHLYGQPDGTEQGRPYLAHAVSEHHFCLAILSAYVQALEAE